MFFGAILTSGFSAGWSIVKLILITVLVLVLAFYSTRLIAKYQNNTWSAKNNLKLPDQMVDATVEKTPKMSFKEVLANMKGNAKDDNEK